MDHDQLAQYMIGNVEGMQFTQGFLLGAAALVGIPSAMVALSMLVVRWGLNRWSNIIAGAIMTVVQFATLFAGLPTPYYIFVSVIEISCTSAIVWQAGRSAGPEAIAPAGRSATLGQTL